MSDCSTNAMKPKDNTMAFLSALDRRFPPKGVAHLEGTEWNTAAPHGFPVSVVFANDGSVLDGTYETRRYVPEHVDEWGLTEQDRAVLSMAAENDELKQRFEQLGQVAREMFAELTTEWLDVEDIESYRERLEALGGERG